MRVSERQKGGERLRYATLDTTPRWPVSYRQHAPNVVMGAVARAEPAAVLASLSYGDATQMRAHANHDQPLGLLDAGAIRLRVTQFADRDRLGFGDLGSCKIRTRDGIRGRTPSMLALGTWTHMMKRTATLLIPHTPNE